jgi:methylaspartate mutase sigma subunit
MTGMLLATSANDRPTRDPGALRVVISGTVSDAHTWNLMFLHLLFEELGHSVTNLGPCVPPAELAERCRTEAPHLVVMSSVNGHGFIDGLTAIRAMRMHPRLASVPVVIGGKLGIAGPDDSGRVQELIVAGFDAVFEDGGSLSISSLRAFVGALSARSAAPIDAT